MMLPDETELLSTLSAVMQTLALVMEKLATIEAQTAARIEDWERRLALLTWSMIITFVAVAAYLIGAAR